MASHPRARGRQVNAVQALALLLAFVLIATVGGVLTAGVVLPAVAIAKGTTDVAVTAFDDLPSELSTKPLSEKSTMLASDGTTVLATFYAENRVVVPLDQIAQIMQDAVVATEDKRFFEHGGIDPTGMLRAAVKNAFGGTNEGASTLTQQYVKNVLIETAVREGDYAAAAAAKSDEGAEGYSRKLREAKLAIALEKTTPKTEILQNYLNIAQFGISVYGVESAAQSYFSKHASELNYIEAATLAGVTRSPTANDPVKNPEESQKRRNLVLGLMRDQKYITQAEYDAGVATPLVDTLRPQATKVGCLASGDVIAGSGYFCDYVTKVMINNPAFGETEDERKELLYRGGLTIVTTLDAREQTIADAEVKAGIPVDDPEGVASAISVVEPGTGKITAMAQNRTYSTSLTTEGRATAVNLNTDKAYGGSGGFAPGSTFKPFTLLEWLKQGHALNETVDGSVKPLNENMFTTCGAAGPNKAWTPGNAEGRGKYMTVLQATMNSVNLAYLDMARQLDMCNIMTGAKELGVHTGTGADPSTNPSNVIGTDSVAPLTMAAAFATFASGGVYCDPIAITSVKDADGNELPVPSANCEQRIEPRIANAMNYALSNVWKGTARTVGDPGFTSAGKTGTTSRNEYTWFVGYTPLRAAAVWVGYTEGYIPVQFKTINGTYVKYMYGSTVAAPTWKRFMTQAMEGQAIPAFGEVGSNELNGVQIQVPDVIGKSEGDAKAVLESNGFNAAIATEQISSGQAAGSVAAQSMSGGSRATKGSVITLTISSGPAPEPPPADQAAADPGPGGGGGQGVPGPGDQGRGNGN